MTRSRILWLIPIALVMLGACSSSSSTSAPSPTTPSTVASAKDSYIAKANALCATLNSKVRGLGDTGTDPLKLADKADQTAALTKDTLAQIRELPVPPGDDPRLKAIYAKVDALVADFEALSARLRALDKDGAKKAADRLRADSASANTASNAYGLTVCAETA